MWDDARAARDGRAAGRLTVGVGAASGAIPGTDLVLALGPHHPASHGALRLRLDLDDDGRVADAEVLVGHLHRGAEKLFEVRDYRQILMLANRHDWLSAFSSELGVVLAVERLLGLEVPARATWVRTLLAELNRVLSHLMFLGAAPGAAVVPGNVALRERETVQAVMEEVAGGRMHFMFNRVGGVKEDLPDGWPGRAQAALARVRGRLPELADLVGAVPVAAGVGVLATPLVDAYGVSGPIARAAGVDLDLRRDEPYLAYGDLAGPGLPLRVPLRTAGDVRARFEVLLEQVEVSLDLAEACLDRLASLGAGPVDVRLPKVLRPPEGSTYAWTENPLGVNGYYVVSRGERTPWRMKLRTASFNNVAVLPHVLRGCRVEDLVPVLASMFFVVGDVDK